jgi:cyclase
MLKRRIAANLVVKDGIVVQSINFRKYLPLGKPAIAIEFLNQWGIDEIILTDISATKNKSEPNYQLVKQASTKCFVPLTVGGGITNIDQIKELMHCGADKISLNQSAIHNSSLITNAAKIFGDQCVVVSIDTMIEETSFKVFDYIRHKTINVPPAEFAKRAEDLGAGEILINSVDRDGSYLGYDLELINSICNVVKVPVICCGGAKNAKDFIEVFSKTRVSAASAANFYHFTEHSVNSTKANINKQIPVRLETFANYQDGTFDNSLRLQKKEDRVLEEMLFIQIEKEVI